MKILFIGDIVGKSGRQAVKMLAGLLREEYGCALCVANGENMAGGGGFTLSCIREFEGSGVDVFTSGDHVWDQKDFVDDIQKCPNVLRPANVSAQQPGRGAMIATAADGRKVGVINLLGRTFMASSADNPFETADRLVEELRRETPFILVDFHAEATSEKIAMGRYLAGRVSAVLGTHTHVPTADEQIFAPGTAFQCDVGMVGARESVLGREINAVVHKFVTGMPARFSVVETGVRLCATVVTLDDNGRATAIERVVRDCTVS